MRFYVYELTDPRDGKVFYVGKGTKNRIDAHEAEARRGRLSRKCDKIRAIEACGLSVSKQKVKTFSDEDDAYDFESELIDRHGLANLTNVIPGGRGGYVGSSVHTIKCDRDFVRAVAPLFRRLEGRERDELYVFGKPIGLKEMVKSYNDLTANVIARRGLDWVNAIAGRYKVIFTYA